MTTEEMLALRKQKEAQVAGMSIQQVIDGLKNDDPLYGLIARLYIARCMEWATDTAGDASQMKEYLRQALEAASQAAGNAADSESFAGEALEAAQRLGAMEQEGKQLLQLLEETQMSDNKAAYLAALSRAAVPTVYGLGTTVLEVVEAGNKHQMKDYSQTAYNAATSPVNIRVDDDGIIEFSGNCDMIVSGQGYTRGNTGVVDATGSIWMHIDYSIDDGITWKSIIRSDDYITQTRERHMALSPTYFAYKKGMKLRFYLQNATDQDLKTSGANGSCRLQFVILPKIEQFPNDQIPRVVDVTVSEQDIAPGDTLPQDSLYLVVDPL